MSDIVANERLANSLVALAHPLVEVVTAQVTVLVVDPGEEGVPFLGGQDRTILNFALVGLFIDLVVFDLELVFQIEPFDCQNSGWVYRAWLSKEPNKGEKLTSRSPQLGLLVANSQVESQFHS